MLSYDNEFFEFVIPCPITGQIRGKRKIIGFNTESIDAFVPVCHGFLTGSHVHDFQYEPNPGSETKDDSIIR